MSSASDTFFTTVGCMDGRVQDPVSNFGRKKFDAKYPDTITEAGLVGLLASNPSQALLEATKNKLSISLEKHHSKGIIIHGHEECAGNPVSEEKHIDDIKKSTELIKNLISNNIPVIGAYVKRSEENPKIWEASEV